MDGEKTARERTSPGLFLRAMTLTLTGMRCQAKKDTEDRKYQQNWEELAEQERQRKVFYSMGNYWC